MKKGFLFVWIAALALMWAGSFAFAEKEKGAEKPGKVQELKIYHDNQEWQEFWTDFGEAWQRTWGSRAFPRISRPRCTSPGSRWTSPPAGLPGYSSGGSDTGPWSFWRLI